MNNTSKTANIVDNIMVNTLNYFVDTFDQN